MHNFNIFCHKNVKVLPKIIGNILGTKVLAIPFPILFEKVLAIARRYFTKYCQ